MPSEKHNESLVSSAVQHKKGRPQQTHTGSDLRALGILALVLPPVVIMVPPMSFFFALGIYLVATGGPPLVEFTIIFLACLLFWVCTIPLSIHVCRSRAEGQKWSILDFLKYNAVVTVLYLPAAFVVSSLLCALSYYLIGAQFRM